MSLLPRGTVTFLFTDIAGSTEVFHRFRDRYVELLDAHRRVIREAIGDGVEISTEGDSFFVVFERAADAITAARQIQIGLANHPWPPGGEIKVRIGIHTGEAHPLAGQYHALAVHQAARIEAAAHGGQVLVSHATKQATDAELDFEVAYDDLGFHRLKDFPDPVRLFQLAGPELASGFPPPRTLSVLTNNLPIPRTSFVARQVEKDHVRQLLAESALVTIAGPGGAGKTRLALEVAAQLLPDEEHGVWLIELANLASGADVVQAVAATLNVGHEPGRDTLASLVHWARSRELLLVLDNCEHVIDSAAELADRLITECPRLTILATSREPLRVQGERPWRIPLLATPAPGTSSGSVADYASVQLFVDRAITARGGFDLDRNDFDIIGEICRRLDGIPLAIELVAARSATLSPRDMLERLTDPMSLASRGLRVAPERHRSLLDVIAWSYNLLSDGEKEVLGCVSVFARDFSAGSAERVFGRTSTESFIELLTSLVDKSVVVVELRQEHTRYFLLESIRKFALEQLRTTGSPERAYGSLLDWALEVADELNSTQDGPQRRAAVERFRSEDANLEEAIEWGLDHRADDALRLASTLAWCWQETERYRDGRRLLERCLSAASDRSTWRACAYAGLGALALAQGDFRAARSFANQALVEPGCNEPYVVRSARKTLSFACWVGNELADAESHAEEALRFARRADDRAGVAHALCDLGAVEYARGHHERAQDRLTQARRIFSEFRDQRSLTRVDVRLALVNKALDRLTEARALLERCLESTRADGDRRSIGVLCVRLAEVLRRQGDHGRGEDLLREAMGIFREHSNLRYELWVLYEMGQCALARNDVDEALACFCEVLNRGDQVDGHPYEAIAVYGIALVARLGGRHELAVRLLSHATHLIEDPDTVAPPPEDATELDREVDRLRSLLSPEDFIAEWDAGRATPRYRLLDAYTSAAVRG